MPELPEVEATRLHLVPVLVGARIISVAVTRPRMVRRQPEDTDFVARLLGRSVVELNRHGKVLLARLDDDGVWVTHLGMSGRMVVAAPAAPSTPHTQLRVGVESAEIRMIDPRTFGYFAVFAPGEDLPHAGYGPDALHSLPTARKMHELLGRRRAPIKALLLDQRFIAGVGNIYADEALWRARVLPHRPAGSLAYDEVKRLRRAVPQVLRSGLARGGTSLGDLAYLLPDGRSGGFTSQLAVYGRTGEPCRRCGAPVQRQVIRQRSSFFCDTCQE